MAGYSVRQQTYVDDEIILAEHTNDEFNQLIATFDAATGHKHDGTPGEGGIITIVSDGDADTKIEFDATADNDEIHFHTTGVKRMSLTDGGLTFGDRFVIAYNASDDTLDIGVI